MAVKTQDLFRQRRAVAKTYGTLRLVDDGARWELVDIPPHVAITLKNLFPRIPKTSTGPFMFPADSIHAADLSWFLMRYPMAMADRDEDALDRGKDAFEREQHELETVLAPDFIPPAYVGLRDGCALRDYQSQAVEILRRRRGLLVGDEVGLGKTFVAAAACLLPEALPAVIVVEPHVQAQWHERIEAFTTLRCHSITKAKPYTLPESDVYLFRYSNIAGWVDILNAMEIGLTAWDEIQSLRKGDDSAKGKASKVATKRARYRLGLTATPIYNYGREIFAVLSFIDDTVLGTRDDFLREWTNDVGHLTDAEALGTYLRDQHVFLRRRRSDVGRELPPVNRIVDEVGYDSKTVRDAEDLARTLAIKATEGSWVERGKAARDLDIMMRQATGIAKASQVADYVRILLDAGEPVLLMGWHRDVYDIWLDRLTDHNPVLYTGSETAVQKRESERAFLQGDSNLLIMSLRSGAGLDSLQERCRTVVFGELDWSPGIHRQVIGRLDRDRDDGVPNNVMAIFLVTSEGSDPPMMEVLGLKASEAHAVNDPGLGVQRANSDRSHLRTLVDRYLNKGKGRE